MIWKDLRLFNKVTYVKHLTQGRCSQMSHNDVLPNEDGIVDSRSAWATRLHTATRT
jgi:hypothetical protein